MDIIKVKRSIKIWRSLILIYRSFSSYNLELRPGRVRKSKNELKLNKFPGTQQTKNLYFE